MSNLISDTGEGQWNQQIQEIIEVWKRQYHSPCNNLQKHTYAFATNLKREISDKTSRVNSFFAHHIKAEPQ